jgi:plasmid stability protein
LTDGQKTSKIPSMKTTFDLPPDLVRAVKLRAVHEGRKLKDVAADLLKRGLAGPETPANPKPAKPKIEIQANGLPVVRCAANAPAKRMTADGLLALERQSLDQEDLQRLAHAL